jgi:hypothetical protein
MAKHGKNWTPPIGMTEADMVPREFGDCAGCGNDIIGKWIVYSPKDEYDANDPATYIRYKSQFCDTCIKELDL